MVGPHPIALARGSTKADAAAENRYRTTTNISIALYQRRLRRYTIVYGNDFSRSTLHAVHSALGISNAQGPNLETTNILGVQGGQGDHQSETAYRSHHQRRSDSTSSMSHQLT